MKITNMEEVDSIYGDLWWNYYGDLESPYSPFIYLCNLNIKTLNLEQYSTQLHCHCVWITIKVITKYMNGQSIQER